MKRIPQRDPFLKRLKSHKEHLVAQISNLLYSRFPIGSVKRRRSQWNPENSCGLEALRYSTLQICATRLIQYFTVLISIALFQTAVAAERPVSLHVDATEASRQILHAKMELPVKPGPLTLLYPKWIPGEHGPTGPVTDLVGLQITASGHVLEWKRNAEEMYAFQIEVPEGTEAVDVQFDFLLPSGDSSGSATAQLLGLSWNQVLLYPKGVNATGIQYAASLRLPSGWKFGTALSTAKQTANEIDFEPVSLETLVDSPVIAGNYFRTIHLAPGAATPHLLHIVADSEAALELKPEAATAFTHLVKEANHLFGAHHYRSYHFLLTLSDHVAHFGLEHHESSDNRLGEKYLTDEDEWKLNAFMLPHEMVHSWNGKYRRPSGLNTPDYQQPMKSELLWVYEGLTDYLGEVLAARSGLWTNTTFREDLARTAAMLDHQVGRKWRSLADTTVAAQLLYGARAEGAARRRSADFYPEGDLIWLEVDVLIRQLSQGRKSLDDFCRKFFGGENSAAKVVPYSYEEVIISLNEIARYDWKEFFEKRVYQVNPRAPVGGIEGSGWRLNYTNTVPDFFKTREAARKQTDLTYSLGITIKEDGTIADVIPESPADKGGIAPGMKLIAVNGRRWKPENLRASIKSARTNQEPIELLLENNDYFKTSKINYNDGEKYPTLERDSTMPDLLSEILKPRAADSISNEKKE